MTNFRVEQVMRNDRQAGLLKMWDGAHNGNGFEASSMEQLRNVSTMPFIHKHVAAMPDTHWGNGTSVGAVIATKGAIVPAAVGVDIGCGMMAVKTTLRADQLPDNLYGVRSQIEAAIPHGRTNNGQEGDRGAWGNLPNSHKSRWNGLSDRYEKIVEKHPKVSHKSADLHLGTLGTGNHFIEICLDEADEVWVMLHSGSRGVGNRIGSYFMTKAKEEMERYFIGQHLPDQNLAYLVEHTDLFDDYVEAVGWAQDYAMENRKAMMGETLNALRVSGLPTFNITDMAVNCHHNYVEKENHFGANVWVTRKGAVRARQDDLGIIPGSMGAKSFIVRGLGNKESFCSCSHGAGRVMSRTKAKDMISLEAHALAMVGIEARLDADIIDESPAAYKDIDRVMAAQDDLVEIVHTLRQVVNVKG